MVEFKAKADKIIKERWGLEVEHVCATSNLNPGKRLSFEDVFYRPIKNSKSKITSNAAERERERERIYGWPMRKGNWCTSDLKQQAFRQGGVSGVRANSKSPFSNKRLAQGADINVVQYLGIAADEPERIARHTKPGYLMPLVEAGWDESYCREWCEQNGLLSPIYTTVTRGGCWFCHNQGIDQLRLLRKNYPDLWAMMLKWDKDSPVTFKSDGRTVHDFDLRFALEEQGEIPTDRTFRWKMLDEHR